jgi:hypothetical protein
MTHGAATTVFVSLAMNQATFFHALGEAMVAAGHRVVHICFHEGSHEWLAEQGVESHSAFTVDAAPVNLADYALPSLNLLLNHERAAYEQGDSAPLAAKFQRHLGAMSALLERISAEGPGPVRLVQELGGFLSVLAAFYEAQRRGIPNFFIEPSFFRGRVFLTRDTLAAPQVAGPSGVPATPEVATYLDETLARQSLVIPMKDRLHYRNPLAKLADPHNIRRLVEKTYDKYVLKRQEEFQHIGGHVSRHVRMYLNNRRLRGEYQPLPTDAPFVYYPLHVPADVALTLRSPEYLDQIALIDHLAAVVPWPCKVALKEHPALVGAVAAGRMKALLASRDNVVLLNPGLNNYDVMRAASAIVTVNSKSGAEALLLGKPVVVLGDAFYRPCALVHAVDRPTDLPALLERLVAAPPAMAADAVHGYFQDVWNASWPGELYDARPENVGRFRDSLIRAIAS